MRSPELLYDLDLINEFLDKCPQDWKTHLQLEFEHFSPQDWRFLPLLKEFTDWAFENLTITLGYELFCMEITRISPRLIRILHEIYSSINLLANDA